MGIDALLMLGLGLEEGAAANVRYGSNATCAAQKAVSALTTEKGDTQNCIIRDVGHAGKRRASKTHARALSAVINIEIRRFLSPSPSRDGS
jgi:hypothetical protein